MTDFPSSSETERDAALVRDLALVFAAGKYEGGETLFDMYANIALKFMETRGLAQCPDQMDGVDQAGARALVLENAKLREQLETWKNAERGLSASYVRLRHLIPGALETPTAPTPEQVWDTTERALERFVDRIASASPDTSTGGNSEPWDAHYNRSYEPVETRAKEIYDFFEYRDVGTKPAWVTGGNSLMQDEARICARKQLRDAGHTPSVSSPDREGR